MPHKDTLSYTSQAAPGCLYRAKNDQGRVVSLADEFGITIPILSDIKALSFKTRGQRKLSRRHRSKVDSFQY